MTELANLLPCPFCGGEAEALPAVPYGEPYRVECMLCPASTVWGDGMEGAIAAWNRRSPLNPLEDVLEEGERGASCTNLGYDASSGASASSEPSGAGRDPVFCDDDGLWVRDPLGNCRPFDINDYETLAAECDRMRAALAAL